MPLDISQEAKRARLAILFIKITKFSEKLEIIAHLKYFWGYNHRLYYFHVEIELKKFILEERHS